MNRKIEEDGAIAELLEPLLKNQRASDYAEPPAVQKPLLNNEWAGLAEKVWAEFEMIFSGDSSTLHLGELLGSKCEPRGYKSNLEGLLFNIQSFFKSKFR